MLWHVEKLLSVEINHVLHLKQLHHAGGLGVDIGNPSFMMKDRSKLIAVKMIHTVVWAIFASSILAIPVCAFNKNMSLAWGFIGFVLIEVIVLLINSMRCPLTDIASRYTSERPDNFDIYLPLWLARNNKVIFGGLYIASIVYTVFAQVLTHVRA